jgi:hypothetical protein
MNQTRITEQLEDMERLLLMPMSQASERIHGYLPAPKLTMDWATRFLHRITQYGNYMEKEHRSGSFETRWVAMWETLKKREAAKSNDIVFDSEEFRNRVDKVALVGETSATRPFHVLKRLALDKDIPLVEFAYSAYQWSEFRSDGRKWNRHQQELDRNRNNCIDSIAKLKLKIEKAELEIKPLRDRLASYEADLAGFDEPTDDEIITQDETENFEQSRD